MAGKQRITTGWIWPVYVNETNNKQAIAAAGVVYVNQTSAPAATPTKGATLLMMGV